MKLILEKAVAKLAVKDVKYNGFGEDKNVAPFDNKLPEGRFYNRTVIIDIIPDK